MGVSWSHLLCRDRQVETITKLHAELEQHKDQTYWQWKNKRRVQKHMKLAFLDMDTAYIAITVSARSFPSPMGVCM